MMIYFFPLLAIAAWLAHYLEISTDELFQLDLKSLPEKGGPNEYEHLSDHSR